MGINQLALPVADKAEQKCVPGSVADAAGLSARKIPGTPNGERWDPGTATGKQHFAAAGSHLIDPSSQPGWLIFYC